MILIASRLLGMLALRIGQPQVVGEMLAGIMLGPSLLGLMSPETFQSLFPADSVGALNVLAQVGIVLFLFLIGLELDPKLVQGKRRSALIISTASIVAPMALGIGLTFYLFNRHYDPATDGFLSVSLFMGAAMSVTAFPVLARILTERNLHKTQIGAMAITCAAANDMIAWCLLAFVVAITTADGTLLDAGRTVLLSLVYITVMVMLVRPFLQRLQGLHDSQGRLSQGVFALILSLVLVSAIATDLIGIHALFGAFMLGAIMPKGSRFVHTLNEKLEDVTVVFLLPIFFASAGLETKIGLLNSGALWVDAMLIIAIACAGKFGGSALAARACGMPWREASAIGILMNTRGLMELVILKVGLDLGVVTPPVFAMLVIMAIVTTALTTPALAWAYPKRLMQPASPRPAEPAGASETPSPHKGYSVLIPVASPRSGGPLVQLASLITGRTSGRIIALHLRRPVERDAYRTGLDDSITPAQDESLEPLLARASAQQIPVDPRTFTSVDVPGDIAQVAYDERSNLVLIGFHNPVFGQALLGGTVARVMHDTDTDVAVFIDRGFRQPRRLLVPFLGTSHDRLALELADRIGRAGETSITVLHVVAPKSANATTPTGARHAVERVFNDPTQPRPVEVRTIESETPVSAVLEAAGEFDLVIIGVSETWGLGSRLFGMRAERIARDCVSSLLIVRKHSHQTAEASKR
ncbi:MAG TPA: cation:proton antiporter [Tepidisphaeraceae bacterium]|nr:cation:proton antiporter [Tepidisphaeraceae bacterium]